MWHLCKFVPLTCCKDMITKMFYYRMDLHCKMYPKRERIIIIDSTQQKILAPFHLFFAEYIQSINEYTLKNEKGRSVAVEQWTADEWNIFSSFIWIIIKFQKKTALNQWNWRYPNEFDENGRYVENVQLIFHAKRNRFVFFI